MRCARGAGLHSSVAVVPRMDNGWVRIFVLFWEQMKGKFDLYFFVFFVISSAYNFFNGFSYLAMKSG